MKIEASAYEKVVAERPIKKGEVIFLLEGDPVSKPSKYSIQIDIGLHLQPFDGNNNEWKFVNHSCDPNAYIDTTDHKIKALKDIHEGKEICFNYNTTEYKMDSPFNCNCGSANCYGEIKGFQYLSDEDQRSLLPFAAMHIKALSTNRDKKEASRSIILLLLCYEVNALVLKRFT